MQAFTVTLLLLAFIAALYPAVTLGFRALIAARDFVERLGDDCGACAFVLTLLCLPAAILFGALDVLFNVTWGSYIFRERPREWLFSSRVQRHYRTCAYSGLSFDPDYVHADTPQQLEAVAWADWLNGIDPGHITMAD